MANNIDVKDANGVVVTTKTTDNNGVHTPHRVIDIADGPRVDAFGRLRTSGTGNRFDSEFIYGFQPDLFDIIENGSASANFNPGSRDVTLEIGGTALGDNAAIYSYDIPYTPGNSQVIDITGTLDNAEIESGEAYIFFRTSVSGSTVTTRTLQADWNVNTLVGDVNWQYSQIFQIDFQSLKIGRIRFGMVRNGEPVYTHQIFNDNIRDTGYWQTPNLPIHWRIFNDATYTYMEMGYGDEENGIGYGYRAPLDDAAELRAICSTVKSEGGYPLFEMPGFNRAADTGNAPKTINNVLIPLISIRPRALFNGIDNRGLYIPTGFTVASDNPMRYVILYRPTLTGGTWGDVNTTYSGMEVNTDATAVSGGIVIDADYVNTNRNAETKAEGVLGRTLLSLRRSGTPDILTIAGVEVTTTNPDVFCSISWREIR